MLEMLYSLVKSWIPMRKPAIVPETVLTEPTEPMSVIEPAVWLKPTMNTIKTSGWVGKSTIVITAVLSIVAGKSATFANPTMTFHHAIVIVTITIIISIVVPDLNIFVSLSFLML